MGELDRCHARDIKNAILAENPHTLMRVQNGRLILKSNNLTTKQRELALEFKQELVSYLKTPPSQIGICSRCEWEIDWICTDYGTWVCSCYYVH